MLSSTFNTTTGLSPLSKAPNHNCFPGAAAIYLPTALGVCSLLCVCTWDGLNSEHKFRVAYMVTLYFTFTFYFTLI